MIQIHLSLKSIIATISETWIIQGWVLNVISTLYSILSESLQETNLEWFGGEFSWQLFQKIDYQKKY